MLEQSQGLSSQGTLGLTEKLDVLDLGFVRLDGTMADDLSVINSARISFDQQSRYHRDTCAAVSSNDECNCEEFGLNHAIPSRALTKRDRGLINFLMRERHGTPFEHNAFRFHVKAPLFIFREWQRHRWSSFNEWSGRYSQLEGEFYIPEEVRTQTGKPGAYTFEKLEGLPAEVFKEQLHYTYDVAWQNYLIAIENGVAKELARLLLPLSIYSQMYWTVNARALMNFLSLRNDENAQWEIQQYAELIEGIFQKQMPITHAAFLENGRVAP